MICTMNRGGFAGLLIVLGLAGCASRRDHFYELRSEPGSSPSASSSAPTTPTTGVRLNVTIPSAVDRNEIVLDTSDYGVSIFEHERWAAPFADQVTQTLARDLELRRPDLLIGDARFDRPASRSIAVKVDIIRLAAKHGGRANLEAHWRIVGAASQPDQWGDATSSAAVQGEGFAAVAQAFSDALASLADQLAGSIPR